MSTTDESTQGLRELLVAEAVALTAAHGPDGLSLREVQRRVGVSPAAAYKHYRDRQALLIAVGQRASALLAEEVEQAVRDVAEAEAQFRAGCRAYVEFALTRPGLFRSILLTGQNVNEITHPVADATGRSGRGPYELLQDTLAQLPSATIDDAPQVWAACHGLAVLLLDGPFRRSSPTEQHALIERMFDLLGAGLTADRLGGAKSNSHAGASSS